MIPTIDDALLVAVIAGRQSVPVICRQWHPGVDLADRLADRISLAMRLRP